MEQKFKLWLEFEEVDPETGTLTASFAIFTLT